MRGRRTDGLDRINRIYEDLQERTEPGILVVAGQQQALSLRTRPFFSSAILQILPIL